MTHLVSVDAESLILKANPIGGTLAICKVLEFRNLKEISNVKS